MAECYVMLKEPDEARTILHRVAAHAKLTDEQQKEVDFQTLYSYVLGGQIAQANKALDDYLASTRAIPMRTVSAIRSARSCSIARIMPARLCRRSAV